MFDLFIIGGGINGCGIARDAAGREYSVALAEMNDFASGTSSAATKLIHGGLRYLEHHEFRLVRESLMERETLWAMAPHIIRPMRFVLPYEKGGVRPAWLIRLGLFLYDHIGGRKLLPATRTLDLRSDPAGKPLKSRFRKAFEYLDEWSARVKITRIGPDAVFHRYLTPKWAFLPTSGAGAAVDGGRFNRPGVEAFYLSVAPQTALEEYRQGASITPPATLAAYKITLSEVADLSEGFDPLHWDVAWAQWDCAWRKIARIDRKVPPSWKLADKVISAGLQGLLFPSLRHAGGTNLVIFPANLIADDDVHVHDPEIDCRAINRPGRTCNIDAGRLWGRGMKRISIKSVQPGDILFTARPGKISKSIRFSTGGIVSHAMICVQHGSFIDSTADGVLARNRQRELFEDDEQVFHFHLKEALPREVLSHVIYFARAEIGARYSVPEAMRSVAVRKPRLKCQYYSRLVARVYRNASIDLVPDADYCSPEDLRRSRLLVEIPIETEAVSEEEWRWLETNRNPIRDTHQAHKAILDVARTFVPDLESLNELHALLVTRPEADPEIAKVLRESGCLDLWRGDIAAHPWRYNQSLIATMSAPEQMADIREYCIGTVSEAYSGGVRLSINLNANAGAVAGMAAADREPVGRVPTTVEILRMGAFWLLVVAVVPLAIAALAVSINVLPFLAERGVDTQCASYVLAGIGAASAVGALAIGAIVDRFHPAVIAGIATLAFFSLGGVAAGIGNPAIYFSVMYLGLAGVAPVLSVGVSKPFGRGAYAPIFGLVGPFLLFSAFSGAGTGRLRDHLGSYQPVFATLAVFAAASLIASLLLARHPQVAD